MRISAIAIISKNRGLGFENHLLFHIPGELPRFKRITLGHPVIMGRKTYESIGRPLPGRTNIVITRDSVFQPDSISVAYSLQEALDKAKIAQGSNEIFILGGGQIFTESMPFLHRLYLTIVDTDVAADTFFPEYSNFTRVIEKEEKNDWEYPYTFFTLEKKVN